MTDVDALPALRSRYLDLIEKSLANAIYGESQWEMRIAAWRQRLRHPYLSRRGPTVWPRRAQSMIGPARLRNVRHLTELTITENIFGDYIETGVWRGGACILIRAVLAAYEVYDRRIFCADSFAGLPRPDPKHYSADKKDNLFRYPELAVPEDEVRDNFARYDLLDNQVIFLKGWFSDTLPTLGNERFAMIRLDGDMYKSTMDALTNLYDRLSDHGFVIVDDYGGLKNCRQAVHDFLESRSLNPNIQRIDESGVWWRKD
jgi:Macrocin-O-methyltransferase (TylF)